MSAAESEAPRRAEGPGPDAPDIAPEPLVERDDAATHMSYGGGGVKWYLVLLWGGLLVGIAAYAAQLLIPSLSSWGAP